MFLCCLESTRLLLNSGWTSGSRCWCTCETRTGKHEVNRKRNEHEAPGTSRLVKTGKRAASVSNANATLHKAARSACDHRSNCSQFTSHGHNQNSFNLDVAHARLRSHIQAGVAPNWPDGHKQVQTRPATWAVGALLPARQEEPLPSTGPASPCLPRCPRLSPALPYKAPGETQPTRSANPPSTQTHRTYSSKTKP